MIVDPQEQRRFAEELEVLTGQIRDRERRLQAGIEELSVVWKDSRYREFSRTITEASVQLQAFYNRSNAYADYLRRKAAAVEKFLRLR
jgi:hypothetical protein